LCGLCAEFKGFLLVARLHPKVLEPELKRLISEASSIEPGLSARLDELRRWIKDKKLGLLSTKTYVISFLSELIADADFLLGLKRANPQEKQELRDLLSSVELYWYDYLFPKWFNEPDPKLPRWKQKMMAGEFTQNDHKLIESLGDEIESLGGESLWKYVVDLSMASDLVVSRNWETALCIQLTTSADRHLEDKKSQWQSTLAYWEIKRALFVSFHPQEDCKNLAKLILGKGDILPDDCYHDCTL
jgi:hypothetical protein